MSLEGESVGSCTNIISGGCGVSRDGASEGGCIWSLLGWCPGRPVMHNRYCWGWHGMCSMFRCLERGNKWSTRSRLDQTFILNSAHKFPKLRVQISQMVIPLPRMLFFSQNALIPVESSSATESFCWLRTGPSRDFREKTHKTGKANPQLGNNVGFSDKPGNKGAYQHQSHAHPNYTSLSSLICNPNLELFHHKQGVIGAAILDSGC